MMFTGWLRPHRVFLAAVAVATGALACSDTTATSREFSGPGITEPRFTAGVGFTSTVVGRGNLGTFHIQSKADGYDVELKSHRHSRCEHRRHTRRDFWLALTSRSRDGRRKNRNADAVSRERSHLLPNASPGRYLIH